MTAGNIMEPIKRHLFQEDGSDGVYAVLDGASIPDLRQVLHAHHPEHVCLFEGELEPDMEEVAPYLVGLEPDSPFTDWVIGEGWGKHWGIFAVSHDDLDAMSRHFRTFLVVYDTDGNPLRFRYYDPRVLRVYLPTCTPDELAAVFGPVAKYLLEGEGPRTALRFNLVSGALQQQTLELS
jgi:hypothetical protein